jgi:hypothetical protein
MAQNGCYAAPTNNQVCTIYSYTLAALQIIVANILIRLAFYLRMRTEFQF